MPVSIRGTGGGGVILNAGAASTDTTLTLPNVNGTILQSGTAVTPAQGGTGLTSPGTAGNVLTSNGTAWTSAAPTLAVINTQTFDSSGTWTKPAGYAATSRVLVQAWGAGGSGGRSTTATAASGGGGGGYIERWLNLSQFGATETITIGAGGAARTATNQNGATGGNTTVGSLVTAYGGGGGGGNVVGNVSGGGGGGQLSAGTIPIAAGTTTDPGRPFIAAQDTDGTGGSVGNARQGAGCSNTVSNTGTLMSALTHGGGGGAGATNVNAASSVYGGGGGGGGSTGTGGTSLFGGNGGAAGTTTGGSGVQPGGGGGSATGTSGAGGDGRAIITIFPA